MMEFLLFLIWLAIVFGTWSDHGKERAETQREILMALLRIEEKINTPQGGAVGK
jgi:hypothetical protein